MLASQSTNWMAPHRPHERGYGYHFSSPQYFTSIPYRLLISVLKHNSRHDLDGLTPQFKGIGHIKWRHVTCASQPSATHNTYSKIALARLRPYKQARLIHTRVRRTSQEGGKCTSPHDYWRSKGGRPSRFWLGHVPPPPAPLTACHAALAYEAAILTTGVLAATIYDLRDRDKKEKQEQERRTDARTISDSDIHIEYDSTSEEESLIIPGADEDLEVESADTSVPPQRQQEYIERRTDIPTSAISTNQQSIATDFHGNRQIIPDRATETPSSTMDPSRPPSITNSQTPSHTQSKPTSYQMTNLPISVTMTAGVDDEMGYRRYNHRGSVTQDEVGSSRGSRRRRRKVGQK
ncbi:hypothetical protein TREMEDRAFT_62809 [Tremella mesenterica DSM 1558]|uniref:uncharacterized protein n=1 Tax=Tremella mesenterica (strain ATCC 24925 / CBS 8224 / DSM 1558 / NBRC 9311 / NRRL Y-6157 / RJB 2259-6 / UBC 559-6) TaxID=578456 RepID=UPI0003F4A579|nr:uncharacterized protein TREMEDRAFT_62809 [Tremella mesenterica DSM 1558]EIW69081.1 hypothetical protein TREMEDRAFT_62809 [Tremella mesenterica DSM 1558]